MKINWFLWNFYTVLWIYVFQKDCSSLELEGYEEKLSSLSSHLSLGWLVWCLCCVDMVVLACVWTNQNFFQIVLMSNLCHQMLLLRILRRKGCLVFRDVYDITYMKKNNSWSNLVGCSTSIPLLLEFMLELCFCSIDA